MRHHDALFQVSLSNGETIFEGKGDYKEIEGQPSPWQRLLLHLRETRATITSLSIYSRGLRFVLPSMGKGSPNFRAFHFAEKPIGFSFFRKLAQDITSSGSVESEELFAVAQAELEGGEFLEIWVSNKNPEHAWTLKTKNSSASF